MELILGYAKQSSTEIIAEGIERHEDLAFLTKQGVHFGQGYALGKPHQEVKPGRIPSCLMEKERISIIMDKRKGVHMAVYIGNIADKKNRLNAD